MKKYPFKFLDAYSKEDTDIFFGRDEEIDAFVRGLRWIASHSAEDIAKLMPEEYALGNLPIYIKALSISKAMYSPDGHFEPGAVGTAYAVWTGIGAVGAAIIGMVFLGESRDAWRLASLALIITGLIGLKVTSKPETPPVTSGDVAVTPAR